MKEIQGYLTIIPNNPDGRGLFHFTLEGAREHKANFDALVDREWEKPGDGLYQLKKNWTEKPQPIKIYSLTVKEEIL